MVNETGFSFEFSDRTMGKNRRGVATFQAPFVFQYDAVLEASDPAGKSQCFNLTTVMIPTRPGWSRIIILSSNARSTLMRKSRPCSTRISWRSRVLACLPIWFLHLRSNTFLDSDLVFLHCQEQERQRSTYFMPAPADRCVAAIQEWFHSFAEVPPPPPNPIDIRSGSFNRWNQHVDSCKHCHAAFDRVLRLKNRAVYVLALSAFLVNRLAVARVLLPASIVLLAALQRLEYKFRHGGRVSL